jgi:diguanylate cyclase (GGDEF)-like protein
MRERFALAMGIFVITSGLVVTVLVEWRLAVVLQASAREHLQHVANEIAHDLSSDVERRRREVSRLAAILGETDTVHSSAAQQVLDGLRVRQPAYAWIGLTDGRGNVLAATDALLTGVNVASRPWFVVGKERDYFGDAHDAKLLAQHITAGENGEPPRFFDIASPVRNVKGLWEGVIGAHLYTDWVHKVVEDAIASRTEDYPVDIFVADGNGDWLLSPHATTATRLQDLLAQNSEKTHLLATAVSDVERSAEGTRWTVAVREKAEDAFAPVYQNRRQMLLITPLAALFLATVTWLIAGRVVRPVVRLADTARQHAATTGHVIHRQSAGARDEASLLAQTLRDLALKDPLSGLSNRSALKQLLLDLQRGQESQADNPTPYAVLLLNLDDFHIFNTTQGHEAGDQLLRAAAMRLNQLCEPGMTVARLGGDEFVVVIGELVASGGPTHQAQTFANRIVDAFAAPFDISGVVHRCQVSVGVAVVGTAAVDPETALANAELAMQEAKRLGKHRVATFDSHLQDRLIAQVRFEQELKSAVPSQLTVLYQPQVNKERKVIGAELLVRWNHPQHGHVSPARFIPVAEQTGLIVPIGRWVLEQACQQLAAWHSKPGCCELTLAVNVSAYEFAQVDYVKHVEEVLERTGADPTRLKLELTESALAVDVDEVIEKMTALKNLGVVFALDDFGTGFSSLSYLKRMPFTQLKIDQSFVRDLLNDDNSVSIVRTIVALGTGLGMDVIAEGVETEDQYEKLAALGCLKYQGYLFGKPKPVEEYC